MLAIDTSSPAVTTGVVSVGQDVVLVAERAPVAPRGHGELLAPAIVDCLAEAGARPRDIGAVVAGVGPGPYTGLRVGLATAAAFADAIGAPAYGVGSLDALAVAAADEPRLLVVADARRREVYWARYERGAAVTEPAVGRPAEIPAEDATAAAGAGAEMYAEAWARLRRRAERHPDALSLARAAAPRIRAGAAGERLTPRYLRRPDAVAPGAPKTVLQ
ncbi:tRNA (adenosine(37)-N6)-threonylcarbamoyltransferase complex dimerization subunit type 1 TsaB [uncultured Jatrophihabitans sp.]|uniref:tRNA (adenosine(37)-N6)-threonylcarbamoyltransferase complex dimerization subunit type 1 TsaB n=1 Tax=uncultured Jatrophihabitans sp. TaxID=1610747 RepID=UPI0035CA0C87